MAASRIPDEDFIGQDSQPDPMRYELSPGPDPFQEFLEETLEDGGFRERECHGLSTLETGGFVGPEKSSKLAKPQAKVPSPKKQPKSRNPKKQPKSVTFFEEPQTPPGDPETEDAAPDRIRGMMRLRAKAQDSHNCFNMTKAQLVPKKRLENHGANRLMLEKNNAGIDARST